MSQKLKVRPSRIAKFTSANHPVRRIRRFKEFIIESLLFLSAASSVFVTIGVVVILLSESLPFFKNVSIKEFLTESQWTPMFDQAKFGIAPLVAGTFLTTVVALSLAIPMGTIIATYLSEYSTATQREIFKPILELLAAVPTVVYGYFALLFISPLLQKIFTEMSGFNVLSAGLVMGIMIIPYISSLTEDAMRAVPNYLREGSFALGASRLQTAFKVVIPTAFSGITSAYILGISRALGETMVVAIAAGMQPNLTLDPTQSAQTIRRSTVAAGLYCISGRRNLGRFAHHQRV